MDVIFKDWYSNERLHTLEKLVSERKWTRVDLANNINQIGYNWCVDRFGWSEDNWFYSVRDQYKNSSFAFKNPDDAMLFKLTWM